MGVPQIILQSNTENPEPGTLSEVPEKDAPPHSFHLARNESGLVVVDLVKRQLNLRISTRRLASRSRCAFSKKNTSEVRNQAQKRTAVREAPFQEHERNTKSKSKRRTAVRETRSNVLQRSQYHEESGLQKQIDRIPELLTVPPSGFPKYSWRCVKLLHPKASTKSCLHVFSSKPNRLRPPVQKKPREIASKSWGLINLPGPNIMGNLSNVEQRIICLGGFCCLSILQPCAPPLKPPACVHATETSSPFFII